jgi:hypothetical protein
MRTVLSKWIGVMICSVALSPMALAGIYESQVLWTKKEIVTCFLDRPDQLKQTPIEDPKYMESKRIIFKPDLFDEDEKKFIAQLARDNYNPSATEVSFTGWTDCSKTPDADLIMVKAKPTKQFLFLWSNMEFTGVASIGQAGVMNADGSYSKAQGLKAFFALSWINPVSIIHELGHVLGLRHEHIHPDTEADSDCKNRFVYVKERAAPAPTAVFHSAYDPNSVMSYCVTQDPSRYSHNQRIFLSDQDRWTLRELYRGAGNTNSIGR